MEKLFWHDVKQLLSLRSLRWAWLLLAAVVLLLHSYAEMRFRDQRASAQNMLLIDRLSVIRYQLESTLTNNLSLINGLAAFISSYPDFTTEQFETYARTVQQREPGLVNLAVAPNLVVRHVYPLAGNESVIGLDYLQQPEQRFSVLRLIETGSMVIDGPVNLVQGGVAFIGRAPVFVSGPDGEELLWGMVSAPLLAEYIYRGAGLLDPQSDLSIAVRVGETATAGAEPAFWGDDSVFANAAAVRLPVSAGGNVWEIAASPLSPAFTATEIAALRLVSLIVFSIASAILLWRYQQIQQQQHLRSLVFRNERFLRAVESVSRVGGWRWNGQRFTELSKRCREILQLPESGDDTGMGSFCHSLDEGSRERVEFAITQALRYQQRLDLELELRRRDHSELWLHLQAEINETTDGRKSTTELVGALQDVTQQKKVDQLIEYQANYDVLTGLPNRALFLDRLQHALQQASRQSTRLAVIFVDLDNFKLVNDNLGHDAGDELLIETARRIQTCLRSVDTVARHSGDEFVAVLVDVFSASVASRVAESIVARMREPFSLAGRQVYCSVSVGLSLYPDDGSDADTLIIKADQAMYEVKKSGRNSWQFYTAAMQQESEQKHQLYNDLVSALNDGTLSVHYQPVVSASTGRVEGCEALVRWQLSNGNYVTPDMFIPLAEERGLVNRIDLFVLQQSLAFIRQLNLELGSPITLSVNVSPRLLHMRDEDAQHWLRELEGAGDVSVTIEITERVLVDESHHIHKVLQQLDSAGVAIAIDDFGTGYSGLSYFSRFPVSVVKIDRSFVRDLEVNVTDTTLVETILLMSGKLGIQVVAEGVESERQAAFLRQHDCNFLQGYHIAPPLSAEAFTDFVRQNRNAAVEIH